MAKIKKSKFGLALRIVDGKANLEMKLRDCNVNDIAMAIAQLEIAKVKLVLRMTKLTTKDSL